MPAYNQSPCCKRVGYNVLSFEQFDFSGQATLNPKPKSQTLTTSVSAASIVQYTLKPDPIMKDPKSWNSYSNRL